MFATGLIVFRETLEAALFVGIITAATKGINRRSLWIACGVIAGCIGSLLMATGMEKISAWANGIGQDLLNAIIISTALMMLTWHCVWAATRGKEIAQDAKRLAISALDGTRASLWALSLAVALSVLREGAETVLFVSGFLSGSAEGATTLLLGTVIGLIGGVLMGMLIYLGLARIRTQHLFSVTNWLILILAGSLASQLAKTLIQAGLVSRWVQPVWHASSILSNDSSLGVFLHAFMGYDASPSGLQLAFYAGAIVLIWLATQRAKNWQARNRHHVVAV